MKKIVILIFILSFVLVSCEKDDPASVTEHTLFMYMPWSTDLTSYFRQNIADFETALQDDILKNNRLIVFFCSSATEATMFELTYEKGKNVRTTLKEYVNPSFTTAEGITSILNDVTHYAPANHYSMIVSSHGMGWLPVPTGVRTLKGDNEKYHWEYDGVPLTRYFGGKTSDVQTDVTTLAKGIADAGIKMDYMLFDDCYMSSIEVAYDLKDVTDYLIASPTEVMAYGFPYHAVGKYLVGNVNLKGVSEGYYTYYSNYTYPYGTIGVTVTAEVEKLATVMKEINRRFSFDPASLNDVQRMDGYSPVIFFDMGDYVSKLCTDDDLLTQFRSQFDRAVPPDLSLHTPSYYSASMGKVNIRAFSGMTISDPSMNVKTETKTETAWYKATH